MIKNRALKRSLNDFKRHPWLHAISISTIVVSLLVLGSFFLCYRNIEGLAERTNPTVTGTVYLADNLAPADISSLKTRILSLQNTQKVEFKEKASVLGELQEFLGGSATDVLPGSDLFPDVFEVEMNRQSGKADLIAMSKIISKYPEVSEVDFSEDWLAHYKDVRAFFNAFGVVLMISILIGCSFITANFMGIRHQSRKNEIDIVRLIGATPKFILMPFVWEGLIEGTIGACLAIIILYLGKVVLSAFFSINLVSVLGINEWLFLSVPQIASILALGVLMACLGSITVFIRFRENRG